MSDPIRRVENGARLSGDRGHVRLLREVASMPLEQAWASEALFRLADWTNCTGEAYFRGLVRGLAEVLEDPASVGRATARCGQ